MTAQELTQALEQHYQCLLEFQSGDTGWYSRKNLGIERQGQMLGRVVAWRFQQDRWEQIDPSTVVKLTPTFGWDAFTGEKIL